jgi:hypothetical protein
MPAPAPIEVWTVVAILRLSHKYDVQYLHRRALNHLLEDGWYASSHLLEDIENHLISDPETPLEGLLVLSAATEVGALWLLPWSYYWTSTFGAKHLMPFLEGVMDPQVRKCLAAREDILRGTVAVNRFLTKRFSGCATPEICNGLRDRFLADFLDELEIDSASDPLSEWNTTDLRADGLCDACCERAETEHDAAALTFWNKIPEIFGLPPWKDLHTMKRAALGEEEQDRRTRHE